MTVETATISAAAIPPKKREYSGISSPSQYPLQPSPAMSDQEEVSVKTPSSPPVSPSPISASDLHHAMASKTGPLRSSGFMITDILSGAASAGLPLPLGLQAPLASLHHHRVPSPHDTASSDAGSNDNDISDDGEDGKHEQHFLLLSLRFICDHGVCRASSLVCIKNIFCAGKIILVVSVNSF